MVARSSPQLDLAPTILLRLLADERRRVFADWRALVLLRRDAMAEDQRPLLSTIEDVQPILRRLEAGGRISRVASDPLIYEVTTPDARPTALDELEVTFEYHPYAMLSHLSALVFHRLTDDMPILSTLSIPHHPVAEVPPLGTFATDWGDRPWPVGHRVASVRRLPIWWVTIAPRQYFGFGEARPIDSLVRVTTIERTLLDGLQSPMLAGGSANVLRAWGRARDVISVDQLIDDVDRLDIAILRQRVGFLLDTLELAHPRLAAWRSEAQRGEVSPLVTAFADAPEFSRDWNLSLNGPVAAIHEDWWSH